MLKENIVLQNQNFYKNILGGIGFYKEISYYKSCEPMCKSCSRDLDSVTNNHHCTECKEEYNYYLFKESEFNCYLNNCSLNNLMQIKQTKECISTFCSSNPSYKYEYNNEIFIHIIQM